MLELLEMPARPLRTAAGVPHSLTAQHRSRLLWEFSPARGILPTALRFRVDQGQFPPKNINSATAHLLPLGRIDNALIRQKGFIMSRTAFIYSALAMAAAILTGAVTVAQTPLAINTARITIAGTSNVHDYTAETTQATVTRVQLEDATPGATFWEDAQKPGALQAFDISIPAKTLKSNKDGLDKNMYKALKTDTHPQITFSLKRMEGAPGALKAIGVLGVAGVEKEVVLPLKTTRKGENLSVTGELDILMTDYGIDPPKALMGMVRASPRIKITFDVLLGLAST